MKKKTVFYFSLIFFVAVFIRAGYLLAPHMDADQATFGLMGWHILQGEFPLFQWGYHYLGTLQAYLDALFFAVLGMNRVVLNLVPLVLSLVFIFVTYLLGKEIQDKEMGLWAALFAALGPYYLVLHGAWARHGYMETLVFGSLLLLFTIKIVFPKKSQPNKNALYFWFGLTAGIAWWTNFLILYYFIACGLFLYHHKKISLRGNFLWITLAFILGSSPFWIYNLSHDFASFHMFQSKGETEFGKNLYKFFYYHLPVILGARDINNGILNGVTLGLYGFSALWLFTRRHSRSFRLPMLFLLLLPLIFAFSRFGSLNTQRYLLPLYSVIPLFLAQTVVTLKVKNRVLAYGFLSLMLLLNFKDNALSLPWIQKNRIERYRDDMATKKVMIQTLLDKQIYGAYCHTYWVGPQLTFDCQEKLVFPHPYMDRYPLYTRKTDALWNPAILTVGGIKSLEKSLETLNVTWEKFNAAPFDFYSSFKRIGPAAEEIFPMGWKVVSSHDNAYVDRVIDRNLRSVWMTSYNQSTDMVVTIELPRSENLCRLELDLGNAQKGAPRKLEVSLSKNGKKWESVPTPEWWGLFWSGVHPFHHGSSGRTEICFKPTQAKFVKIRLAQPSRNHNKYWALGEVFLYRSLKTPYQQIEEADVIRLTQLLKDFSDYRIYADTWLSAYLQENHPKLNVADTWIAPIDNDKLNAHVFRFKKPLLFIVTQENKKALQYSLEKLAGVSYKIKESSPYTFFLVTEKNPKIRWYWTGKQLVKWKRVPPQKS